SRCAGGGLVAVQGRWCGSGWWCGSGSRTAGVWWVCQDPLASQDGGTPGPLGEGAVEAANGGEECFGVQLVGDGGVHHRGGMGQDVQSVAGEYHGLDTEDVRQLGDQDAEGIAGVVEHGAGDRVTVVGPL